MASVLEEVWSADLSASDPGGRDPEFIEHYARPRVDWLRRRYFRSEIEGVENVPRQGPFIAVANHGGGPMLADMFVMLSYWWEIFGVERPSYALVHDAAFQIPGLRNVLIKLGALRASRDNAEKVLAMGGVVLVTPGGDLEALRSFWKRDRIEFHGHTGFIALAVRNGVPLVPLVNVGGHEVYLTLWSSRWLARWSGLERFARIKTVPLNLGLPWGLWWTGVLPFLPLPAKISYKVGRAFEFGCSPHLCENTDALRRASFEITHSMQSMVDELAARRRLPMIG